MKKAWNKILTAALALLLLVGMAPLSQNAQAEAAYGKTTDSGVRVRKKASTSADYWFKLDEGYVCEVRGVISGNPVWYKVCVEHPDPGSERTYIGYIHGDFFRMLTDEEKAEWESNPVQTSTPTATPEPTSAPTSAPTAEPTNPGTGTGSGVEAAPGATGQVTNNEVNFRVSEGGELIDKLNAGTVVELLTIPLVKDENNWFKVRYNGKVGYIQAPFVRVISEGDPSAATVAPGTDISPYGYVKLILSSANMRETPAGTIGAQWENKGEILEVVGPYQMAEGVKFKYYPVYFQGAYYFVREDCVQLMATPVGGPVVTAAPSVTQAPESTTVVGYVRTIKGGVNLRLTPGGEMIVQIKRNLVLPMLKYPEKSGSYKWYYVETEGGVRGYIRHDCVTEVTSSGDDAPVTNTPAPTATLAPGSTFGYVITVETGVNLRKTPAGTSQEQIKKGVVVPMTGPKEDGGKYDWYPVRAASGRYGYLRSDCVAECDKYGNIITEGTPTATPEPTQAPGSAVTPTPAPQTYAGYIIVTTNDVNLRKTPGGSKVGTVQTNEVWPMTDVRTPNKTDGYYWYPVIVNGTKGYVRSDCAQQLTPAQVESYLAGNGVPPVGEEEAPDAESGYVITVLTDVNLREKASKDSSAKFNVPLGTVMAYKSKPVGSSNWYKVVYNNTEVWVLGTCVEIMTVKEYEDYLASNPATTPQPDVILGYVRTIDTGVNVRATANGSKILGRLDKGTVISFSAEPVKGGNYYWYKVRTIYGEGFVRDDMVELCDQNGNDLPIVTPSTPPATSGQEASYTTLKLGSKGQKVTNLVTELKRQGYYTGAVTSTYTSTVQKAVKKFQEANGLVVDGIAGSATQHKLFGTVPVGEGNYENLEMTLYPAEKIDWFTGGIQQLWPKGANYKIYDVKTGIVWWAHRWSGGYHADIEPLTAADTARLCRMYGVSKASDINYKDHWHRRPSLVTIGNRTFACSLDGVPHNPDGDTIDDNDMIGQVCLHFTNSKGHESGKVSETHQEAIEYAYKNAPNGHK